MDKKRYIPIMVVSKILPVGKRHSMTISQAVTISHLDFRQVIVQIES